MLFRIKDLLLFRTKNLLLFRTKDLLLLIIKNLLLFRTKDLLLFRTKDLLLFSTKDLLLFSTKDLLLFRTKDLFLNIIMASKRPSTINKTAHRPLQCQLDEIQKILNAIENDNRSVKLSIFINFEKDSISEVM